MRKLFVCTLAGVLLGVLLMLASVGVAHAQATRTWVSGVGDDANPCSRTAPCSTFAGSYSKTSTGGMISVLDPGDFGPLTITHAITIDGNGSFAGSDPDATAMTAGFVINAAATDQIIFKEVTIRGSGTGSGVSFMGAGNLTMIDCSVSGFDTGLDLRSATGGSILLARVAAHSNANIGVRVGATTSGFMTVAISDSRIDGNIRGLVAENGARVTVYDTSISGNGTGVIANASSATGVVDVNLEGATIDGNNIGVSSEAAGGKSTVRFSGVGLEGNGTPTQSSGGGALVSFGNNAASMANMLATSSMPLCERAMAAWEWSRNRCTRRRCAPRLRRIFFRSRQPARRRPDLPQRREEAPRWLRLRSRRARAPSQPRPADATRTARPSTYEPACGATRKRTRGRAKSAE